MSFFSRGFRGSRAGERTPTASMSLAGGRPYDDEKSAPSAPYPTVQRRRRLAFPYAINPSFIRLLRLVLYTVTSLSSIATAVFAILVVAWYDDHSPSIKPSWGSDIALAVFGIITPAPLFATLLLTPRIVRRGGVAAALVGQVRSELFLLFNLAVIWVSGALAMAVDLRGYDNCIWDGYYHWPKPADFRHVCDLINYTVIMGYVTFGLVAMQWFVVTTLAVYILLYLDQEVLTEPAHDMGGRAYRAHLLALSLAQDEARPMAGGRPMEYSEKSPTPGPMAGGRLAPLDFGGPAFVPAQSGPGPMAGGRPRPQPPQLEDTGSYGPRGGPQETGYEPAPRSPTRHRSSQGSADAREFDEEGLAEFARRPSTEQPRRADENGYVDYSRRGANPFEYGHVE